MPIWSVWPAIAAFSRPGPRSTLDPGMNLPEVTDSKTR